MKITVRNDDELVTVLVVWRRDTVNSDGQPYPANLVAYLHPGCSTRAEFSTGDWLEMRKRAAHGRRRSGSFASSGREAERT